MKKALVAALVAAALAGGGYYYYTSEKKSSVTYRTAPVERGEIIYAVSASGTINPVSTVQVGSQVSGTIAKILVDFNSPVSKGQVIARIDPRLFEAAVVQARANLDSTRAALEKAKIQVSDAARTLARNKDLIKNGYVAQSDVDAAEVAHDSALTQQKSTEAQIQQQKGALSVAETNLGYTTIVSPVRGVVISRNIDAGQTVAASFQTPTLFTIAEDLTKMQIDTSVDESDVARARVGQVATFTVDAYPEKTFTGEVAQVRNAATVTQNVVTYDVVIKVDNKELLLKPGMTANVAIQIEKVSGVLKIPNAALRYRPAQARKTDERKAGDAKAAETKGPGAKGPGAKGPAVFTRGKDGKPVEVPVKLGISDGTSTQLLAGELKEGDLLVTGETQKKSNGQGGSPPGMGGFR